MAYKHILIAVDLSPESKVLVDKAVSMARPYNAKVSLIHVDVNYSDLYTGLIDVNLGDMQKRIVVKRPDYAPPLAGVATQSAVVTKSHRFDIYPPLT